ncbi:16S rRNA (guanine(527)-N(7))-methyltransferase RsmG [Nodularia spumigena CS-584]|jgi:16S rRNA (guanine527-N7)-methyltransferase|uniref:Ribosomal RNA small subunit methyltransferase G n=2 Tax=Nodularia spumigena TaxID=70799 RepID=A0A2S0Q849_NODSP|nr:16S rRNA (guanine(527)-N(7))-methyltransferase RsmG [Nodularia spumigena]AHJ27124.1 rRNA small subunit methyltransferase, glucose inhibited division protein GidB [Nodularia spumigena CCY9414]AVZ30551.1 ribosomal RNA small subunit methyltransferase G [Nodularia spumigena UHCC 0039]EAW43210.1 glucose-inhibited division protein B [Nodularia spumigena CCY9414]MDB9385070.1 16S rRNA (guanine(527)-N(7))-methyltransferase RsmG [Nodularia spumigena CS-584]MEA5524847.1 16S rRNA (guanine(527)-N(7))-me
MTNLLPEMAEIWQQTLNWQPDEQQQQKFQQLYELIVLGNQQLNLTRITDPQDFWEKHLWDSLRGIAPQGQFIPSLSENASIIDIGTGAGFPGIPVAITVPNCTITLLDSTRKKINFINETLTQLTLSNAKTLVGRAEEIGHHPQHRKTYDIALIRAVSNAAVCAEYTLPLLKHGGLAVIYRGNWTEEETKSLQNAVNQLGGIIESLEQFTTPLTNSIRHCLYLRKVVNTPASFPRGAGVATQKPLS